MRKKVARRTGQDRMRTETRVVECRVDIPDAEIEGAL